MLTYTHSEDFLLSVEPFRFISLELVMGYIIFDKFYVEEIFSRVPFLLFFSSFFGAGIASWMRCTWNWFVWLLELV